MSAAMPSTAHALIGSSTTVGSSANPSSFGASVTLTATVTGLGVTPTGTVTFMDGTNTLGASALNDGQASFSTSGLATGSHSITAVYGGDTIYNSSTSTVLTQTVAPNSSSTTVTSSANPSALEQSVIFTATVTGSGGTPTGTVAFLDGTTTLGTGTLNGSGQATYSSGALLPGSHSITAAYEGDSNFSSSTSAVLTQVVNVGTSSTAVTASANPTGLGQPVTFTATVSGLIIEPTGTVTFKDGTTTLGTGTLNGSGQASFTTSALASGNHSITAVYGGDTLYNSSTSAILTETVVANSSSTTVTSSPNPSALQQSVTFTATVTSSGGTPTGTVTFMDGSTALGTGTLNGGGQASYTTSQLLPGSHAITAAYGGDGNFASSTSGALTQVVNLGTSSTAVTSSANPSALDQPVTFTATVSGLAIEPTGTVTFKDGATTLGTGTLNGSGQASLTTGALTAGTHSITAVYGGDAVYNPSTSPVLSQAVNQSTTTTAVVSSANPSAQGGTVMFTATVSGAGTTPTGFVTFKDNGTTIGTGTLNGSGQATVSTSSLALGSHPITAVYGGDTNYYGSTSPVLTQNVNANSSATAVVSSVNPSTFGQSVTFTATVTSSNGTPTGTVTFKDGSTTLGSGTLNGSGQTAFATTVLASGSHSITAVYGGDSNFGSSTSSVLTQTVNQNSSATSLSSSANPSAFGAPVTFMATVNGTGGTPTGTVTFKDGATIIGSGPLNGSGQATLTLSSLSAGAHSITAAYGGDSNFAANTSPVLVQQVTQSAAAIALTSSANPSVLRQPVTFTVTVTGSGGTPTGTVTVKDGNSVLGTVTLASGAANLTDSALTIGKHAITATYSGDANFASVTSAVLVQAVDTPADSLKLRAMQVAATAIAAQVSGNATSGAIDSAVADGFADDCRPLTPTSAGLRLTWCQERNDEARLSNSFQAFNHGEPPKWLAWADLRGTEVIANTSSQNLTGRQMNATVGLTYRFTPDVLAGVFGGYEFFDYTSDNIAGQLRGDGWTVGGYFGWRFLPGLRFEAGLAHSGIDFDGMAGTASASFPGNRTLVTVGLTGNYKITQSLEIEPSTSVYGLWENESAYTDSLGTAQAERSFSTGRASGGAKLIYHWQASDDLAIAPYTGIYADYDFSKDTELAALPSSTVLDGLSARVVSGLSLTTPQGCLFAVGGELGGLGGDFITWTINARASITF